MTAISKTTLPIFCCMTLLAGCAMQPPARPTGAAAALRGSVYGGQQPVAASAVYLYAATSGSTATPSVSLLKASSGTVADGKGSYYAPTDSNGNFNLAPGGTPAYTCTAGQQLYVISVGGNAGLGTNASLIIAAALGDCSTSPRPPSSA